MVFRATDAVGLTKQCTLKVTVTDNAPPAIFCPGSVTVTGSGAPCKATVLYATPVATDNCSTPSVFLLSGLASGSSFPAGTKTNTWWAVTSNGQIADCSFTVTVTCGTGSESAVHDRMRNDELSDKASPLALRLAPNPATTEVKVWLVGGTSPMLASTLTVFDVLGNMVCRQALVFGQAQATIDLSHFEPGAYWVSWQSESGVLAKRLIVQK